MDVLFQRPDGSFVINHNGLPYHVTPDDPLFAAAQAEGEDAPFEPAPAPPTPEELLASFTAAIDGHVETTARAKGYNGAAHLASYAASTVPAWAAEATAFISWRDAVWVHGIGLLAEIEAGTATIPTPDDVIAALPEIVWP